MNVWATILTAFISKTVGVVITYIVGNFRNNKAKLVPMMQQP